jgi:hypothetical protein
MYVWAIISKASLKSKDNTDTGSFPCSAIAMVSRIMDRDLELWSFPSLHIDLDVVSPVAMV